MQWYGYAEEIQSGWWCRCWCCAAVWLHPRAHNTFRMQRAKASRSPQAEWAVGGKVKKKVMPSIDLRCTLLQGRQSDTVSSPPDTDTRGNIGRRNTANKHTLASASKPVAAAPTALVCPLFLPAFLLLLLLHGKRPRPSAAQCTSYREECIGHRVQ